MNTITPFLWFENNMSSVIAYYQSVFAGTTYTSSGSMDNTPSGHVDMGLLNIFGQSIQVMTAGKYLPFSYTVSFLVSCESREEVETLFNSLAKSGSVLMPLQEYPFAPYYGWCTDAYGVSWQVIFAPDLPKSKVAQKITTTIMFSGNALGMASEFADFYVGLLGGEVRYRSEYQAGEADDVRAKIKHEGIALLGTDFAVMDSGRGGDGDFKQAISLVLECGTQAEVNRIWNAIIDAGGTEIQCGWIHDRFGFPWQVVPKGMNVMLQSENREAAARAQKAMMGMIKLDLNELQKAFDGK